MDDDNAVRSYSDELVELGNQAWILNCALAELYRFKGCLATEMTSESGALRQGSDAYLAPAVARLGTRLEALLTKWRRRLVESGVDEVPPVLHPEPWGWRAALPAWVRDRWRVERLALSLAEARALAAREPERFVVFYPTAGADPAALPEDTRVQAIRFGGVPLNVARMWWAWGFDRPEPVCRLRALAPNLWQIDRCGGLAE